MSVIGALHPQRFSVFVVESLQSIEGLRKRCMAQVTLQMPYRTIRVQLSDRRSVAATRAVHSSHKQEEHLSPLLAQQSNCGRKNAQYLYHSHNRPRMKIQQHAFCPARAIKGQSKVLSIQSADHPHGIECRRGDIPTRPFPAHSSVTGSVIFGRLSSSP